MSTYLVNYGFKILFAYTFGVISDNCLCRYSCQNLEEHLFKSTRMVAVKKRETTRVQKCS